MSFVHDLYVGRTHLNFLKTWKIGITISLLLIAASVLAFSTRGLNYGIDFEGGTSWELPANGVSVSEVRSTLEPLGAGNAKIQIVGGETIRVSTAIQADPIDGSIDDEVTAALAETTGSNEGDVKVSRVAGTWEVPAGEATTEEVESALEATLPDAVVRVADGVVRVQAATNIVEITDALADLTGVQPSDVSISNVGPSWGEEITKQAIRALVAFFIIIALYLTIRLEWKMTVGALAAVVHDIIITVGVYSIFQFEVTPGTVISFLTILGYSLYDTIVVFDKVRENGSKTMVTGRMSYTDMVNLSLNEVFPRSINATVCALIPVASLLFVGSFLLGAVTIQEFSLALFVGLIVGAYSSLYIACPVTTWLKEREPRNRQIRERLAARGAVTDAATGETTEAVLTPVGAPGGSVSVDAGVSSAPGTAGAMPSNWSGNHPPRPRKKTRRKR